jgi:hypothetical protein
VNKQSLFAVILLCAVAVWAASAAAGETFVEPTGFGKAKFGMPVAQVHKLYPKLHPAKATEAAAGKGDQLLTIYLLEKQSVGPLKPCTAEFRFLKDELYEIQFRCPDRVKVGEYLQKTFGTPTKVAENAAFWMGKNAAVSLAPRSGAFAYGDRERTQALQAMMWASMHQPQAAAGATPPAAEATPAAPEAAPAAPEVRPAVPGVPHAPPR